MKDTPDYAKIRYAKRKVEDDAIAHAILDQGLVAHVGFIAGDRPMVIPMAYARDGDRLYIHGATKTRAIRKTGGNPMCLTVTLIDGLVCARSGFNHSVNYRSVMLLGRARLVSDERKQGRRGGMMRGRKSDLALFFAAKGIRVGVLHEVAAFGDLARHIVARTIERNDAAQRFGAEFGLFQILHVGADEGGEMRSGAVTHQNDPRGIKAERLRLADEMGERIRHVLRLLLDLHGGHEAVIDRGEAVALREVVRGLVLAGGVAFVTPLPAAAMHKDHKRRARGGGSPIIELLQRIAAIAELDGLHRGRWLRATFRDAIAKALDERLCLGGGEHEHEGEKREGGFHRRMKCTRRGIGYAKFFAQSLRRHFQHLFVHDEAFAQLRVVHVLHGGAGIECHRCGGGGGLRGGHEGKLDAIGAVGHVAR